MDESDCRRSSDLLAGKSTSIMSEKYWPSRAAAESATFPPFWMTWPEMSLTIPTRSIPEAWMMNLDVDSQAHG
jgi:hypothetical protein